MSDEEQKTTICIHQRTEYKHDHARSQRYAFAEMRLRVATSICDMLTCHIRLRDSESNFERTSASDGWIFKAGAGEQNSFSPPRIVEPVKVRIICCGR